ncbi:hypothetical protein IRB23SM22_22940 [Alkalibacterium sp. s-m-22]
MGGPFFYVLKKLIYQVLNTTNNYEIGSFMSFSLKKLIISTSSVLVLSGGIFPTLTAVASEESINEEQTQEVSSFELDQFIEDVEPYVIVNEDGFWELHSGIPTQLYEKYNLEKLEDSFLELQPQNIQATIQTDSNINRPGIYLEEQPEFSTTSTNTFASRGYNVERYWWGTRTFFTNAQTTQTVSDLGLLQIGRAGALGLLTIKFPL